MADTYLVNYKGHVVQSDEPGNGAAAILNEAPIPGASTLARITKAELRAALHGLKTTPTKPADMPEAREYMSEDQQAPASAPNLAELEAIANANEEAIEKKKEELRILHSQIAAVETSRSSDRRSDITPPPLSARSRTHSSSSPVRSETAHAVLSPKDIDALLRGGSVPAGSREYLQSGAGFGGGRRGSYTPATPADEESKSPQSKRRSSIAEKLYAHVQPKVPTRRASHVDPAELAAAAADGDRTYKRKGQGHGGGVKSAASRYGFKGNYGSRYNRGDDPGGSRIWMPGNIDLPAELGMPNPDDEMEDAVVRAAMASRRPSPEYLMYAERLKSLRLRDGGGLVQILGIDLDAASAEIQQQEIAQHRTDTRKVLHLIITGPAFGINFAPYVAENESDEAQRYSNTVVFGVSKASPFHSVVSAGDPVIAIDGEDVAALDYEHTWQRILTVGATATEEKPHTLSLLLSSPALARAKLIMRAELEHNRREEILAKYSSVGITGLDKPVHGIHDDKLATVGTLVKESRKRWDSSPKVKLDAAGRSADAEGGSPDGRAIEDIAALLKQRRSSYAEMAGFRGAASEVFGTPMLAVGSHENGAALTARSGRAGDMSARSTSSRVVDPTVFRPVTVQLDDNTVASCRATKGGYMMDVTFTTQPDTEVQSTLVGSAADGVVAPGDQLVRVGIYDLRNTNRGGPSPTEIIAEAVRGISPLNPLHLRFYRAAPQGVTHSAGLPIGLPKWAAEALSGSYGAAEISRQEHSFPVADGAMDYDSKREGREETSVAIATDVLRLRRALSSRSFGHASRMEQHNDAAADEAGPEDTHLEWVPVPRLTPSGALVTVRQPPREVQQHLVEMDEQTKQSNEQAAAAVATDRGKQLDDILAVGSSFRSLPSHVEDILIDVTFSVKPFGILLAPNHTVGGVINGTQAADALQIHDEIVALGGLYVWSAEVQRLGGLAQVLAKAASSISLDHPFTISFVRRASPRMPAWSVDLVDAAEDGRAHGSHDDEDVGTPVGHSTHPVSDRSPARIVASRGSTPAKQEPASPIVPSVHRGDGSGVHDSASPNVSTLQAVESASPLALGVISPRDAIGKAQPATRRSSLYSGYEEAEKQAWSTAVPNSDSADNAKHVNEVLVTFKAFPYYMKLVAGDPDPTTGKQSGIYVYSVKSGTFAAEQIRPNDKLVKFDDIDVSHMGIDEVKEIFSDPSKWPTESAPRTLTFHRIVRSS